MLYLFLTASARNRLHLHNREATNCNNCLSYTVSQRLEQQTQKHLWPYTWQQMLTMMQDFETTGETESHSSKLSFWIYKRLVKIKPSLLGISRQSISHAQLWHVFKKQWTRLAHRITDINKRRVRIIICWNDPLYSTQKYKLESTISRCTDSFLNTKPQLGSCLCGCWK